MKKYFYITIGTFLPLVATAQQTYTPLQPITLPGNNGALYSTNIATYLQNIFSFGIAIAGGLAVIEIVWGGFEYMFSEAFNTKEIAKKRIQNAVYGLLIALCAYVILYTINPKLVQINFNLGSNQ